MRAGGGDSSSSNTSGDSNTTTTSTNTSSLAHIEYIQGVYDLNLSEYNSTIVAYTSISNKGIITTYARAATGSCYTKNPSGINQYINGKTVSNYADQQTFYTEDKQYGWYYGDGTSISRIIYAGSISGANYTYQNTSINLTMVIRNSNYLVTSPTAADLESKVCTD